MTKDTKELLDKTGRFLIEKRGTMHIKVSNFQWNSFFFLLDNYFDRVKVIWLLIGYLKN